MTSTTSCCSFLQTFQNPELNCPASERAAGGVRAHHVLMRREAEDDFDQEIIVHSSMLTASGGGIEGFGKSSDFRISSCFLECSVGPPLPDAIYPN